MLHQIWVSLHYNFPTLIGFEQNPVQVGRQDLFLMENSVCNATLEVLQVHFKGKVVLTSLSPCPYLHNMYLNGLSVK